MHRSQRAPDESRVRLVAFGTNSLGWVLVIPITDPLRKRLCFRPVKPRPVVRLVRRFPSGLYRREINPARTNLTSGYSLRDLLLGENFVLALGRLAHPVQLVREIG